MRGAPIEEVRMPPQKGDHGETPLRWSRRVQKREHIRWCASKQGRCGDPVPTAGSTSTEICTASKRTLVGSRCAACRVSSMETMRGQKVLPKPIQRWRNSSECMDRTKNNRTLLTLLKCSFWVQITIERESARTPIHESVSGR